MKNVQLQRSIKPLLRYTIVFKDVASVEWDFGMGVDTDKYATVNIAKQFFKGGCLYGALMPYSKFAIVRVKVVLYNFNLSTNYTNDSKKDVNIRHDVTGREIKTETVSPKNLKQWNDASNGMRVQFYTDYSGVLAAPSMRLAFSENIKQYRINSRTRIVKTLYCKPKKYLKFSDDNITKKLTELVTLQNPDFKMPQLFYGITLPGDTPTASINDSFVQQVLNCNVNVYVTVCGCERKINLSQ